MNDKFSGCLRNLDIRESPSNHNLLSKFQCMIKIMYGMVNDISAKNISITYSRSYLYTLH